MSLVFLLCTLGVHGQEKRMEVCVDFRVNKTNVDSSFSDNAVRVQEIISFLQDIRQDSTVRIVDVSFCGAASPEGSYQLNRKLAQGRLTSLEKLVRQEVEIPDSIITRNDSYIPWDNLKSLVEDSDLAYKKEVLAILDEEARLVDYHHPNTHIDNRIVKLKQLDGGKVWQQINRQFFSSLRNACTVIVTYREEPQPEPEVIPQPVVPEPAPEPAPEPVVAPEPEPEIIPQPDGWTRQLHVKTNAIGLAMAIANVAVEVDICKHLSFTLPIYYSAWDYFKPTLKFRTLMIQPELRYWFSQHNEGFFVGAHFGYGYYNFALDGAYRYQDHNRETPSIGGGLSVGYRTHLDKKRRWKMEFAVGGGYYDSKYDKFYNEPNGRLQGSYEKTYIGPDNVSISIAYAFNLSKKGGKK
jgi:hypothetical protein